MPLNELKQHFIELDEHLNTYVGDSVELIQLKGFKFSMLLVTHFAKLLLMGSVILGAILFLSLAVAFLIGEKIGSMYYGFLIVGLFYVVAALVCYGLRNRIEKPVLKMFSKNYFTN